MPDDARPRASRAAGTSAAVFATTVWASAAVIGKAINAPVPVMLAWRHLFAIAGVLVFARLRKFRFERAALRASAIAAPLFAAHVWLFFAALQHTSVAVVVVIYALTPLVVLPVAAWQFGERPPPVVWLLAASSIAGVALVVANSSGGGGDRTLGIALSVCNVFGFVAFTIGSKHARERGVPTLAWMLAAHVGACGFNLVVSIVSQHSLLDVHGVDWVRIVALGLLPGLLGHATMFWAYRSIDVSVASIIAVGEPVLSAAGAALFLGESLEPVQVLGIAVVCVTIAAVAWVSSRPRPRVPVSP